MSGRREQIPYQDVNGERAHNVKHVVRERGDEALSILAHVVNVDALEAEGSRSPSVYAAWRAGDAHAGANVIGMPRARLVASALGSIMNSLHTRKQA